MPGLAVFSRRSLLADEFEGVKGESIATWLSAYFSKQVGVEIKHRFGRFMVGMRDTLPIYCYGIGFRKFDKPEQVSPAEEEIGELYRINAAETEIA
jgi:hypothetical protein